MGEWLVGQWIVGAISFQKIFGLCGLKAHIVEKVRMSHLWMDGRTKCEDSARILETEFAKPQCQPLRKRNNKQKKGNNTNTKRPNTDNKKQ